ncbi:hypothetical protein GCM10027168_17580 [Streptomyces capparidis]
MTAPTATPATPGAARPAAAPGFTALPVTAVTPAADDGSAVAVTLRVPQALRDRFAFSPGQYLTVRARLGGTEVRRAYSVCSTPRLLREHGLLRIGVRTVEGGAFSPYAARTLAAGDTLDAAPPAGRFTTALDPRRARRYAALVAGSGVTPVLSLVAAALETEPASAFTVVYGNRTAASAMFAEELADLKDRHGPRLNLLRLFSRETHLIGPPGRRLDPGTLRALLTGPVPPALVDEWFVCGPAAMVRAAEGVLAEHGAAGPAVRTELFHDDEAAAPPPRPRPGPPGRGARVTLRHGGRTSTVRARPGQTLLDAALADRPELPFSCRSGVCATCRARVVEGRAEMARNRTLTEREVADGYVLTCQATPATAAVDLDFDVA